MRRKDKEIQSRARIEQVIEKAQVCRLGLCKDNMPYIVPVSFGYDGEYIYFHTATEGMKLDYLTAQNRVCFELEHEVRVVPDNTEACKWSFSFYSVIGFGTVEEITSPQRKLYALNQIMQHYSDREWNFNDNLVEKMRLWRISIEQITGKQSKDKPAN
jgi:nitroimidazol reductase NimA-like FMN-containing flavoprotein (pyridoxamine 5'-phosphate oxidase superfamily)